MYQEKDIIFVTYAKDDPNKLVTDSFVIVSMNGKNGEDHIRCVFFESGMECAMDFLDKGIINRPDTYTFSKDELENCFLFGTVDDEIFKVLKTILDI